MNIRKLIKISQNTHTKVIKTPKLIYLIFILILILGLLNFLKKCRKRNGAVIRLNRGKMGDILLIKKKRKKKHQSNSLVNVIMRKYKN